MARPIKSTRHRGEREYHAGMPRREVPQPPHFRSSTALTEHIASRRLGIINSREWKEEWAQRWVVYADLVAFASRALRSESVVLNNIVRFDRASTLVAAEFPEIAVRRFSDATFAVAGSFHQAMAFGIALSHTCLAFNRAFLNRGTKPFFIHLIAPRITIANGQVLLLPTDASHPRFDGIDPRNVLAGSAIVRAYQLERHSAGGLLTIDENGIDAFRGLEIRGDNGRVTNGLRRWVAQLGNAEAIAKGEVFFHRRRVLDVPWLLLRPLQDESGRVWGAHNQDADAAIETFLKVWDKSVREFYSPQNFDAPLDVSKHSQAALRHGVQCHHAAHGRRIPKSQSFRELLE